MDNMRNNLAMKKKRELLVGINPRKMSLRKHIDLKQNECRLDITQITKCVFLGSLCLKPVPQLFDSPVLLEELDMKVGNISCSLVNNENRQMPKSSNGENTFTPKDSSRRTISRKCLNMPKIKKKSLRERNESKSSNGTNRIIKNENSVVEQRQHLDNREKIPSTVDNMNQTPKPQVQKDEPRELVLINETHPFCTAMDNDECRQQNEAETLLQNRNVRQHVSSVEPDNICEELANQCHNDIELAESIEDMKLNHKKPRILDNSNSEEIPPDIKTLSALSLHYDDVERLKREPTPELILSDSDEDAIDQLMFNIMDIKVGPNVFDKEFLEIPEEEIEQINEYSEEFNVKDDFPTKEDNNDESQSKNLLKRTPQCKICSQVFSSYVQLKKHKAAHNGDKPYLCVKCNENHTTLDQLIAHLRTHQGKRPYVCKKCNKGFRSTKALEDHQPVHVLRKAVPQKKAFKCEVCMKGFHKLCDLERHTRVHTGEKPSVCNICNKRFQQAHNLNKHLLIHTKEKPYQCDICNKKFGRNDVLNRHLLTHSVKKPNHCKICMKSFIRASQLVAHNEKSHGKEQAS